MEIFFHHYLSSSLHKMTPHCIPTIRAISFPSLRIHQSFHSPLANPTPSASGIPEDPRRQSVSGLTRTATGNAKSDSHFTFQACSKSRALFMSQVWEQGRIPSCVCYILFAGTEAEPSFADRPLRIIGLSCAVINTEGLLNLCLHAPVLIRHRQVFLVKKNQNQLGISFKTLVCAAFCILTRMMMSFHRFPYDLY